MKYWIWLSRLPYIGAVTANNLLREYRCPEAIYSEELQEPLKKQGLNCLQIDSILYNKSLEDSKRIQEQCEKNQIRILTASECGYPLRAREQKDSPILLFYKGTIKQMDRTIGIVGARRCTQEAKQFTVKLTEEYVARDTAVISGMAKGIDSYAHTACLGVGGYTVAVCGNGLDICYPSEHFKLMQRIIENGLLISEYPPGTPPSHYSFPRRNRIISAWSDKLIVIEPGNRSGAMITAEYGEKYGRAVEVKDFL